MNSLIFDATSAPCCAFFVKNKNGQCYSNTHPIALESIVKESYMDNFLVSCRMKEEANKLVEDVIEGVISQIYNRQFRY